MPFVGYPSAFFYATPDPKLKSRSSVEHWPWGYFVRSLNTKKNGFLKVRVFWKDKKGNEHNEAWVRQSDLQPNRLLEVNFVDIGQGDGCFVVFPDDSRMLIDAGVSDNMFRFLRWRFNKKPILIHQAIITHPDLDHYFGFQRMVDEGYKFGEVYHNGIVERANKKSPLGSRTSGRGSVLTDIIETPEQLESLLTPTRIGKRKYPNLLKDMQDSKNVGKIWMLHVEDGFVPGFEEGQTIEIEVLGPFPERHSSGRLRLPWFSSVGQTKNGHSVVLRLRFGNFTAFLGGDLNIRAENYLLNQHTGLDPTPESIEEKDDLLAAARPVFQADVMKACHHGSADFTATFIEAVNPLALVTSSGDDEPHSHPRPEALGSFGKYSRGRRPLVFSTELARSTKERTKTPEFIKDQIDEATALLKVSVR